MKLLQKFVQVFDLHFLEERNAYCRFDKHGDIEDVISIVVLPNTGGTYGGTVVTFNRKVLDEYLALTEAVIVRTFDFTHYRPSQFGGWSAPHLAQYTTDGDLSYGSHLEPGHASYLRGFQIVRPVTKKEALIQRHDPTARDDDRQYAHLLPTTGRTKLYGKYRALQAQRRITLRIQTCPLNSAQHFSGQRYSRNTRRIQKNTAWKIALFHAAERGISKRTTSMRWGRFTRILCTYDSRVHISDLERGVREVGLYKLRKIAKAFNTTMSRLLSGL